MITINPTIAGLRPVEPLLTTAVAGVMNKPDRYVGLDVLPVQGFGESKMAGVIAATKPAAFFGDGSTNLRRAPGAAYPRGAGPEMDTPIAYRAQEWAFADFLDDATRLSAELDAWNIKITAMANRLAIARESTFADTIMTAGNWSNSFGVGTAWSAAGSNPFSDIEAAFNFVDNNGLGCNTLVMDQAAFRVLRKNDALLNFLPTVKDRNFTTEAYLAEALMEAFGLEKVRILKASKNTANAGAAASLARISSGTAGKVWLGYIERSVLSQVSEDGSTIETAATALMRITPTEPTAVVWRQDDPPGENAASFFREAIVPVIPALGCLISGVV